MKLQIKICGMREVDNIQAVLAYQPDFLGFIFYEGSSRYVDQYRLEKISAVNFGPTEKVGVFVNEDPHQIITLAHRYTINYIQLHGDESDQDIQILQQEGLKVIKVISVANASDLEKETHFPSADHFLLDTKGEKRGGNGVKFDWSLLSNFQTTKPFFLSGGLGVDDVEAAQRIAHEKLIGLDLNSRLESAPGQKDITKVQALMNEKNI